MSYPEWKYWFKSLSWQLKWFVVLVLIRPLVDNFYYLKNISPFLSPLYIVGIATPILCLNAIFFLKRKDISVFDYLFGAWSLVMAVSLLFLFIYDPLSKTFLEYFLKLTMPIYLYFFLRLLIRSKNDLNGLLQTFIYSCVLALAFFLFDIFVNPDKVQKTRGLERIQGSYGDIMNYAIYMTQGFLVMAYFYFKNKNTRSPVARNRTLIITVIICFAVLFKISHTASYAVFFALFLLFILFNIKTNRTAGFFLIVIITSVAYFFGAETFEKKVAPLLQTDIAVYEGKKSEERLLHGRVGRWKMMLEEYSEFPIHAQLLGMPLILTETYAYISTGAHNDFIRILFYTGFSGLLIYLLILLVYISRLKFLNTHEHFLALGLLTILILYSVSTCPTLYASMLYVIVPAICYLALPKHVFSEN